MQRLVVRSALRWGVGALVFVSALGGGSALAAPDDVITNPSETPLPTATAPDDVTLPDDDPTATATATATAPGDFTLPDDEPTATATAPGDFTNPEDEPTATAPGDFTNPEDEPTATAPDDFTNPEDEPTATAPDDFTNPENEPTATAPDDFTAPSDEPAEPDAGDNPAAGGAADVAALPKAGAGPGSASDTSRDVMLALLTGGLLAGIGATALRARQHD